MTPARSLATSAAFRIARTNWCVETPDREARGCQDQACEPPSVGIARSEVTADQLDDFTWRQRVADHGLWELRHGRTS